MPSPDWQTPTVVACVFAAAVYLLSRLRRFVFDTRISGCGDCPKSSAGIDSHDGTHVISEDQISITVHDDDELG